MKPKILLFLLLSCFVHLYGQKNLVSKLLPNLKEFKYIAITNDLERIYPNSNLKDSLPYLIKQYHKQLPDIGAYNLYLVKLDCHKLAVNSCLCFNGVSELKYELLILRNKNTNKAQAFITSYELLSDSEYYQMSYTIKANQITLKESGATEGENGQAEVISKSKHTIKILKNGALSINSH